MKRRPGTARRREAKGYRWQLLRMASCHVDGCPERDPMMRASAIGEYLTACFIARMTPRIPRSLRSLRSLKPLYVCRDQTPEEAIAEQNWTAP